MKDMVAPPSAQPGLISLSLALLLVLSGCAVCPKSQFYKPAIAANERGIPNTIVRNTIKFDVPARAFVRLHACFAGKDFAPDKTKPDICMEIALDERSTFRFTDSKIVVAKPDGTVMLTTALPAIEYEVTCNLERGVPKRCTSSERSPVRVRPNEKRENHYLLSRYRTNYSFDPLLEFNGANEYSISEGVRPFSIETHWRTYRANLVNLPEIDVSEFTVKLPTAMVDGQELVFPGVSFRWATEELCASPPA